MANNKPAGFIRTHPLADDTVAPAGFPVDRDLVARLERSFEVLRPQTAELAARFYDRIFAVHPQLRQMFPADMTAQNLKLVKSLEMVIDGLKHPAVVRARLKELGATHHTKGVAPEHYPIVRRYMLEVMGELAGPAWTEDVRQDWTLALEQISKLMISA